MSRGRIHLYCGEGKGKTTAAMGLAARAAGQEIPVVIVQFLKARTSAELKVLSCSPWVFIVEGPEKAKFTFAMSQEEKQAFGAVYQGMFHQAAALCRRKPVGLLVMDEAVGALDKGMLSWEEMAEFLRSRPEGLEVVLTGRNPSPELVELADYITEMKKLRHPFDRGEPARRGIEF